MRWIVYYNFWPSLIGFNLACNTNGFPFIKHFWWIIKFLSIRSPYYNCENLIGVWLAKIEKSRLAFGSTCVSGTCQPSRVPTLRARQATGTGRIRCWNLTAISAHSLTTSRNSASLTTPLSSSRATMVPKKWSRGEATAGRGRALGRL